MRKATLVFVLLAALAAPSTAVAAPPVTSGRVVGRPVVKQAEVRLPLLVTSPGPVHRATLSIPRRSLSHPTRLRLGDRVRARNHAWSRVTKRAGGPTFARLSFLVSSATTAGQQAATDLRHFASLPPSNLTGRQAVTATRDDTEKLRERLNLVDAQMAGLDPQLASAITGVQAAYSGQAGRFRSLRAARDSLVARYAAARSAGTKARKTIEDAVTILDARLAEVPPGGIAGIEVPISAVGAVSDATTLLLKTLAALP